MKSMCKESFSAEESLREKYMVKKYVPQEFLGVQ